MASTITGQEAAWKFASIPDFINFDLGSIKDLPAYDGGPDSSTPEYEALLGYILDSVRAENPEFVAVAGDLVMGHWDVDWDNRRIFGPVATDAQKSATIRAAGDHYYGLWKQRFSSRGLLVHAALGDHEIGDNDWAVIDRKSRQVGAFKDVFARNFTENSDGTPRYPERPVGTAFERTAYAFRHRNALFVSVDVFLQRDPWRNSGQTTGTVIASVADGQLEWLRRVLAEANADPSIRHIFVQGHVPTLRPTRAKLSSAISLQDENGAIGASTAFWRTLAEGKVDLYLCGEVHDVTASKASGVYQIAHGGIIGMPIPANYLVVEVTGEKLDLKLKSIPVQAGTTPMWQTNRNRPDADGSIAEVDKAAGFRTAGTLTIDKSGGEAKETNRTGWLLPVGSEMENLLVYWDCEQIVAGYIANGGLLGANHRAQPAGAMELVSGRIGKGINFGTNGAIYAGLTPIAGCGPRTTSIWIKTSQTTRGTILGFGEHIAGKKWELNLAPGGGLELDVVGALNSTLGITINDGVWHHVALTFPGDDFLGKATFYVDGRSVSSNAPAGITPDTGIGGLLTLGISHSGTSQQRFQGLLDDVGLWSRQLSATEIRALYALGTTLGMSLGDCDGLLAAFRAYEEFTDTSGRRWYPQTQGLSGEEGMVGSANGELFLHLGNGAGMGTVEEVADPFDLHLDFEESGQGPLRSRKASSEGVHLPSGAALALGRIGKGAEFSSSTLAWDIPLHGLTWDNVFTTGFWYKRADPSTAQQVIFTLSAGGQVIEFGSADGTGHLYVETGGKRRTFHTLSGDGNWHHLALSKPPGAEGWPDVRVVADGVRWSLGGWDGPWPTGGALSMTLGGSGYSGRCDDVVVSRRPVTVGEMKVWHRLGILGLHSAYGGAKLVAAMEPGVVMDNRSWLAVPAASGAEVGSSFIDTLGRRTVVTAPGVARATTIASSSAIFVKEFHHEEAAVEFEWLAEASRIYQLYSEGTGMSGPLATTPAAQEGRFLFRIPKSLLRGTGINAISVREAPGPWLPPAPSLLASSSVRKSLRLEWASKPGMLYGVQQSDDLMNWTSSAITPVAGTGGDMVFTVPAETAPGVRSRYFRLSETGPTTASTPLSLTRFTLQGPSSTLLWSSTPGRQYGVLFSTGSQDWKSLGVTTSNATGGTTERTYPLPGGIDPADVVFQIKDVTNILVTGRTPIPSRVRLVAKVSPDKTYRLAASTDLVNWNLVLARDLSGPEGQLEVQIQYSEGLLTNSGFFRLEEE